MNVNALVSTVLKALGLAGLYGLWTYLVIAGKADPMPLVSAIGVGLSALLGYHAVTNLQGTAQVTSLLQSLQQLNAAQQKAGYLPTIPPQNPTK